MEELIDRQDTLQAIIKKLCIKDETYLLESERKVFQQIADMPTVKAIPVESIEMLLQGMRIGIASDREEVIESCGNGTGIEDYYKGYISAINYIEGWLAEK